jgi:TonB-dependent receptor
MFPGSSFPTADISPINAGNPNLTPYFSDNFDLGLEYYTGGPGLIAVNAFSKDVSGFTVAGTTQEKFGDTGIPYSILTPLMQAEFNANGGNNVQVVLNSQVNLQQKLHIRGLEVQVVQPLDFVWEGIGVTANYTRIQQHVDAGLTPAVAQSVATGIPPWMANFGAYYEGHGFSMHVTYNYTAAFADLSSPAYDGVQLPEYTDIHRQVDLAASYILPLEGTMFEGTELTFDAVNLNNEMTWRRYVGNKNAPDSAYWAGPQYTLGLRGKF